MVLKHQQVIGLLQQSVIKHLTISVLQTNTGNTQNIHNIINLDIGECSIWSQILSCIRGRVLDLTVTRYVAKWSVSLYCMLAIGQCCCLTFSFCDTYESLEMHEASFVDALGCFIFLYIRVISLSVSCAVPQFQWLYACDYITRYALIP